MSTGSISWLSANGVESIVIAVLALLFASVWRLSREPGTATLAAGFALAALWYFFSETFPRSGPQMVLAVERIGAVPIALAVLLVSLGVVQYLGMPSGPMRWFVVACWTPTLTLLLALAATPLVPYRVFHLGVLVSYLGPTALALQRSRQQPGDGHLLLALALLTLPLTPVLMIAFGVAPAVLKYVAALSVALFGMALLTIGLLRRHRALAAEVERRRQAEDALREANTQLESRVAQRTAHLNDLIGGLEAFTHNVSHDLRGPLGGMSALARLAVEGLKRGDASMAQRALPTIASQCDASLEMVVSMLELARIGKSAPERVRVDLAETVRCAYEEVMLTAPVERRPALSCGALPPVMGDRALLRAVLVNLIGNAVKFSRHTAQPRIDVNAEAVGNAVCVCVRDNGAGFDADMAERIFDPFVRAHGTRFAGHGIGLSIVRRAVEAMQGRVWAKSGPDGGASLCFELSAGAVADQPADVALHETA